MASAAPAVKEALYELCLTLWPQDTQAVRVFYGWPGMDYPAQFVMVGTPTSDQQAGPMNPSTRPKEETVQVPVTFSTEYGGGPEAQQPATEAAYALFALFEAALRDDPTLGLNQVSQSRHAYITSVDVHETDDQDVNPQTGQPILAAGRICDITALVQTKARV